MTAHGEKDIRTITWGKHWNKYPVITEVSCKQGYSLFYRGLVQSVLEFLLRGMAQTLLVSHPALHTGQLWLVEGVSIHLQFAL